jgi:hypothetical protein
MTGVFLLAWVVFPALMLVLCAGAGLAVRAAAGPSALPALLVLPAGLALLVVVGGLLCDLAALARLAAPAFVVIALVGLFLGRATVRRAVATRGGGRGRWALAAALGAWAVVAAPVVLSGRPGFTGYGHIVDIAYQFDLAGHFAHSGRQIPTTSSSAYQAVMQKYLGSGYPGGGQWTLGAMSNLMPVDLAWLYQPFLAFVSAMSALSLYSLLGLVVRPRALRALGAFVAAQPSILFAYALGGGIKELSTTCFLLLLAALFVPLVSRARVVDSGERAGLRPGRSALAVPIALAATIASLSLTTLPWVGVLSVGVCLTALAFQRERIAGLLGSAQIAVLAFVLSLPTLAASAKLLPVVNGTGPVDLGNLAAPMPAIASAGVWISGDVRFPQYAHRGVSEAMAIVVLVLAAGGVVHALRRRAWSLAWLAAAAIVALYYVAHRYGPWIQFKADSVSSPIALLLAFAGVGALMATGRARSGWRLMRIAGALLALLIAGAVLVGNALLYHDVTLAPYARLHDLQLIGERYAGRGPTLTPDFEEYAEYFLRDNLQTSMVNGPALILRPGVNRAVEPGGIFAYDMAEFEPSWLQSFATIVMRRDPLASRPPSNYRLTYVSPYYEVWQRSRPASTVYADVPFGNSPGNRDPGACAVVRKALRKAGSTAEIAYTTPPRGYVQVDGSNMALSGAFSSSAGTIIASGAGRARRGQLIPATGTYDFFIAGSFGRPVDVSIDGRHVGTAAYQVSYPGRSILVGSRKLTRGVHEIEISRGGLSLHPGNGDGVDLFNRTIGPLVIVPARPVAPPVHYAGPRDLQRLCRSSQPLRWIEVIRPA